MKNPFGFLLTAAILSVPMIGCSFNGPPVGVAEQAAAVDQNIDALYGRQEVLPDHVGLYQAMARGIKYNVEGRDAQMSEMIASGDIDLKALGMLPAVTLGVDASGRNRQQYTRARSKATGGQSLELSQFEDQYERAGNLALSWNTLDAGLGFIDARQASDRARAVTERRRKIIQDIAQDIRAAYWRAASAQLLEDHVAKMIRRSKNLLRDLEEAENRKSDEDIGPLLALQKSMSDTLQELMAERDALATAHLELAALMGLPPSAKFRVDADESVMMTKNSIPSLKSDARDLEVLALMIRPEMREQVLLHRVAEGDIHRSIVETFPGIGGILGYSYDSNSFLDDESWMSASIGLTQNVIKIFSLPQRYRQAENNRSGAELKSMVTTATVLAQTDVAYARYGIAQDRYDLLKSVMGIDRRVQEYASAKKDKSLTGDAKLLSAQMNSLLTRTRLQLAYAEAQNAYGRIVNSVGLDPLPPQLESQDVETMARTLQTRFDTMDRDVISSLLAKIRDKTDLLDAKNGVTARSGAPQNISVRRRIVPIAEMSNNKSI